MTLTPRCECSTCDACPNPLSPWDRIGYCDTCQVTDDGAGGYREGSHEPLSDRELDAIRDEDEYAAASGGGRVCYICGTEDVDTTRARLGDVAGQVTAIADRIVNVCGVGKCDA
tara:strand:- start:1897 stop:2238 length:342 start_codon:yes stop_codon:yes gene_type:complete